MKRAKDGHFVSMPESEKRKPKMTERNARREWTTDDTRMLKQLVKENTPTRVISVKMGRPVTSIYYHARKEEISLKPANRSPYGPRKMSRAAKIAARRNLEKARQARA
jgi:hypothetical protein